MKAKIGLDAGHGGSSSGTYSVNSVKDGLFEKDFALEQALLIEKHLLRNGFSVAMTRRTDKNPGNVSERAKFLAKENCDFSLSIHFNGFGSESANGTEVFVPYQEKIAEVETGFYNVLGKYFKRRAPFARSNNYYNRNEIFDKKLNPEKRRFDAFSGEKDYFGFVRNCWGNGISADLLEICFLTNQKDFKTYIENREEIAAGIAKSIVEGFGEEFVFEEEKEKIAAKPRIRRKFDVLN
ncbi:MAG: N-acetylmuramoyl-L-alanine amidase [Oscillospiraceae bacterium]|nr:N-acetylmuramoyl-L-alanine amidase [Oscillospiraceae bacterium]